MHPLIVGALAFQVAGLSIEVQERAAGYEVARQVADSLGRPLLNIGCPAVRPWYPCGDVCLDTSLERLRYCQSRQPTYGDVRAIPFPDRSFGAVCCFHVLEHLPTIADAERALGELHRVADHVFVASPMRWHPWAVINPEHQLWVHHAGGQITFEQRYR